MELVLILLSGLIFFPFHLYALVKLGKLGYLSLMQIFVFTCILLPLWLWPISISLFLAMIKSKVDGGLMILLAWPIVFVFGILVMMWLERAAKTDDSSHSLMAYCWKVVIPVYGVTLLLMWGIQFHWS